MSEVLYSDAVVFDFCVSVPVGAHLAEQRRAEYDNLLLVYFDGYMNRSGYLHCPTLIESLTYR